jgi:hypothetical protein
MDRDAPPDRPPAGFWRTRWAIGWLVLAAVAGWLLWEEHRAHLLGALPYLIVLACPLMHLFMHRGHHGHGHPRDAGGPPAAPTPPRGAPREGGS